MTVGQSVGSCRIAFALRSFMTILAAGMTLAAKRCSSTKFHWHVTISPLLPNGNRPGNSPFCPTLIILPSSGKSKSNLFGHLHGQLQVYRLLGTYPGLHIPLQTINEMEESFRIINVTTLHEPLAKVHNMVGHIATLYPFGQGLMHFECVVSWLEIRQQSSFYGTPPQHITLNLIPGMGLPF